MAKEQLFVEQFNSSIKEKSFSALCSFQPTCYIAHFVYKVDSLISTVGKKLFDKQNTVSSCASSPQTFQDRSFPRHYTILCFCYKVRKFDLQHCHTASQKCFSDESQCWMNPRPHSTTFVYREIIVIFNTPNKTFFASFTEKSNHCPCSGHVTTEIIILGFWTTHPQIFTRTNGLLQVLQKSSHIIII